MSKGIVDIKVSRMLLSQLINTGTDMLTFQILKMVPRVISFTNGWGGELDLFLEEFLLEIYVVCRNYRFEYLFRTYKRSEDSSLLKKGGF